jgi:inner membrane protein
MIWGALAQSIPDIDFVAVLWLSPPEAFLAHRGFTHSLVFGLIAVVVFSVFADRIHKPRNIAFSKWLLFFFTAVFIHLFVDYFNNYGIGWLEPFNHTRFSCNSIYVFDPLFSLLSWMALIRLIVIGRYSLNRRLWWRIGLLAPLAYIVIALSIKLYITKVVNDNIDKQHILYTRYFSTPAPLQCFLWYIVVQTKNGFYIGYYSVFDYTPVISFHYVAQGKAFLKSIDDYESLQRLIRFSQQYYTVDIKHSDFVFNDLRFGQINGWSNPKAPFVFHYFLTHPTEDNLVIQKGRFSMFNYNGLIGLISRIAGN